MRTFSRVTLVAVLLGAGGWTAPFASARGVDRSPEQILKELDDIKIPTLDASKKKDRTYVTQFLSKLQKATKKRDALILELYKADPDHERVPALMAERWSVRPYGLPAGKLHSEIDEVLAQTQNQKLKIEGNYAKTFARLYDGHPGAAVVVSMIDDFLKLAPGDPRGATLMSLAVDHTRDAKLKTVLEDRILKEFPESPSADKIQGIRHRGDSIGKPFDLEFIDAISGTAVSLKKLRGKVVVLDFWATWCGPCVAEMPAMKKLYSKYHDQGVEFIGVSLDQPEEKGGLKSLRSFVKENAITWPQYYQGHGWDSEFSSSCGIHAIPAAFIIDTDGILFSTEARGKLDTLIPELLKKGSAPRKTARTSRK
jgi:thiol-disulfide isomerase/thioredoxin